MILKTIKNIILFTITFAVTLLVFDFYIKYAGISQLLIYNYDKYLGRVFMNEAEYTMTTEGFGMGTINRFGYIGPGYATDKTPGRLRIALLGDSYIEGFQHFDRNHLRAVIERELKEKFNIEAEVLNFGRFGYNLLDEYSFYNNYVSKFDPDITLFFISEEDPADTTSQQFMPHPYLKNDSIKINYTDIPARKRPWYLDRNELSKVSPTMMMIRNCITLVGKGETVPILLEKFAPPVKRKTNQPNTNEQVIKPLSPIAKKILEQLAKDTGNIIVYRDQVPLAPIIKESITKTGIDYISITETVINEENTGNELYFIDKTGNKGHWNIAAYQLIGSYLAEQVAEKIQR